MFNNVHAVVCSFNMYQFQGIKEILARVKERTD